MTLEEKIKWLKNTSAEELLKLYVGLVNDNRFGKNSKDIALTKTEILKRVKK